MEMHQVGIPPEVIAVSYTHLDVYKRQSVYSFMEAELPKIRGAASFVSMDFSDRYEEDYLKRCCPYIDCAEISCGDMPEDEIQRRMARIMELGCRHIVIATRGSKGAYVMVDGRIYEQSPCLVTVSYTHLLW